MQVKSIVVISALLHMLLFFGLVSLFLSFVSNYFPFIGSIFFILSALLANSIYILVYLKKFTKFLELEIIFLIVFFIGINGFLFLHDRKDSPAEIQSTKISPQISEIVTPTASPSSSVAPTKVARITITPGPMQAQNMESVTPTISLSQSSSNPKLIFGIGPEADAARDSRLNREVPLGMYTSWFNRTEDLQWMQHWEQSFIPEIYRSGRVVHLVIWNGDEENGTPCGRQYPIGSQVNSDMERLAQIFGGNAGDPPLYVTLFTEFQTFPCVDNQWQGAEEYYTRLQAKMLEIQTIFKQHAPNARVSIGWGGWQARYDDPTKGGGRTLIQRFDSVNRTMDFQSFQAMQHDTNVNDVRSMTQILGKYGQVMLAHHKPDGFYPQVFEADIQHMLTSTYLAEMQRYGLFAWSFMDDKEMQSSESIYEKVKSAVTQFGTFP